MEPIMLTGRHASAYVYAKEIDQAAAGQVIELLNQPFTAGQRIRMMPDVHAGMGCTVGTTMTVGDKLVPSLVGVDIGCGMYAVRLKETHLPFDKLDKVIRTCIPSGMEIRKVAHRAADDIDLDALVCVGAVNRDRARRSIGTLGGGNHFIEVDKASDGSLYLVIHTGSRFLGKQAAEYWQSVAYDKMNGTTEGDLTVLSCQLRAEGMSDKKIKESLKAWKNTKHTAVPRALCWLEGTDLDGYVHDMKIIQAYADLNRRTIARELLSEMKLHAADAFSTVHNYLDTDRMILRKGAVSAQAGERLLIPMNMRDGALLCVGRGNPDWNFSAPHGAGRLMSRGEAKASISMKDYKAAMAGIWTSSVSTGTVDESPMAYKPMQSILDCIEDTVTVTDVIKPLYNFKAGEE